MNRIRTACPFFLHRGCVKELKYHAGSAWRAVRWEQRLIQASQYLSSDVSFQ
ncbi:hypothetical protein ACOP16_17005 [Bacillus sp. J14]|uniref:hypothetical protein n=1 Tax=Bacillus sp. J14 TaxID=3411628 RepID=UPI003B94D976